MPKVFTLCHIRNDNQLLLKMQVRNIGKGKWNGPGGKVEAGETPEEACIREVKEETGLTVTNLFYHGLLEFFFDGNPEAMHVHLFSTRHFTGVPRSTEEGEVRWTPVADIPFEQMWDDDRYWMTLMLQQKKFDATFHLDADGRVARCEFRTRA